MVHGTEHGESRAVTVAILCSFLLTFAAVVVVSETRVAAEVDQWLDMANKAESELLADEIAQRILDSPEPRRDELVAALVREQRPDFLMRLFQRLVKKRETTALAIEMIGMAAERYQHVGVVVLAAREYSVGRFVQKDYPKAIRLYSKPLVRRLPGVKYYLAEIYLAEDNPERDAARGLSLLHEAAGMGQVNAAERLRRMEEAPAR